MLRRARTKGWEGLHCEGRVLTSLYGLLLWEVRRTAPHNCTAQLRNMIAPHSYITQLHHSTAPNSCIDPSLCSYGWVLEDIPACFQAYLYTAIYTHCDAVNNNKGHIQCGTRREHVYHSLSIRSIRLSHCWVLCKACW